MRDTSIKKLDNITNVAVYLMAYLSDIEVLPDDKENYFKEEIKEIEINGERKAFIKGSRLNLYPSGVNIIRHSRGIKYPETKRMTMKEAERLVEDKKKTYHTSFRLSNEDGYETVIDKSEYQKI